FRNRLDAVIGFAGLPPEVITKVVEKFIFQLEAQLADRGVTIELTEAAAKWIGEKGYDEKFGARPLARVIQEHIKKPLADELLFGKLEHGGTVKVLVAEVDGDKRLDFELIPADPSKKARSKDAEDDEEDTEEEAALVEAVAAEQKLREGPDPVELARARTALEQARAALATAEADLDEANLRAPIAGTVVDLTLKPGTLTVASDAVSIADLRGFLIRGQVTEQDVGRVAPGQIVQVSVDSVPGESFPGEVLLVSALPSGQSDPNQMQQGPFGPGSGPLGGLYPVEIAVQSDDARLRVGMATTASIEVLAIRDVLSIPLQAVEYGEEGPFVRREGGEQVPVELGAQSGDRVQVLGGLAEGDQVVVPTIPPMEGFGPAPVERVR
ncbi:MAG TPA: efflux RND transporter periplasmic adaptor subunit, partial [Chloroflexaceae bacterium]|nr:efflux RND transporter periplasmic adaptor subunit [Chloroflexaceae bacterium]